MILTAFWIMKRCLLRQEPLNIGQSERKNGIDYPEMIENTAKIVNEAVNDKVRVIHHKQPSRRQSPADCPTDRRPAKFGDATRGFLNPLALLKNHFELSPVAQEKP
jgi:hypothetical protein